MGFLYNIGIHIYGFAVRLASLFNRKAAWWVSGRKGMWEPLARFCEQKGEIVWFHVSSLGEFEQGRPVMEQFRKQYPQYRILLTFFSPSGYRLRSNYDGADYVCYMPLDTRRNARRFVRMVDPSLAIFIKYEFWLNHLEALRASKCKTYIVSAIFRPDSVFFKPYGGVFRRCLGAFEKIFVQDERSKKLLAEIGYVNVTVAGDTRFDRVVRIAGASREVPPVAQFSRRGKMLIAGSTWPEDERIIVAALARDPDLYAVVAQHELDNDRIRKLSSVAGVETAYYSEVADGQPAARARLFVIDTIGLLSSLYKYGTAAYIGGGFGAGIHNTLEAAVYGIPVSFGPNYGKFREANGLIEAGAACPVGDAGQLYEWWKEMVDDTPARNAAGKAAAHYVRSNAGATGLIMAGIFGK